MDRDFRELQDELGNIPEPRSGRQAPTSTEISNQHAGMQTAQTIRNLYSEEQADKWYPDRDLDSRMQGTDATMFERLINASLAPVRGVVGTVDYATGNSRASSLGGAIERNVREDKRLWGDVTGRPVLGFAMDVMSDPLNWMTAGTTALVPRVAHGFVKGAAREGASGALRGAAHGGTSRVMEAALMTGALARGGAKVAGKTASLFNPQRWKNVAKSTPNPSVAAESAQKSSGIMDWMHKRSHDSLKAYDEIVGTTTLQRTIADKTPVGFVWRRGVGDLVQRAAQKTPLLTDHFNKYWKYSNSDWARVSQIRDVMLRSFGRDLDTGLQAYVRHFDTGEDYQTALNAIREQQRKIVERGTRTRSGEDIPGSDLFELADPMAGPQAQNVSKVTEALKAKGLPDEQISTFTNAVKQSDEAAAIGRDPDVYITGDHLENTLRLVEERKLIDTANLSGVRKDIEEMIRRGDMGETGVRWWDNIRKQLRTYEITVKEANKVGGKASLKHKVGDKAAKMLDAFETLLAIFKRGSVGASPTAWTNSILGNLIMGKMTGIDVMDPIWMGRVKESVRMAGKKDASSLLLDDMFDVADMLDVIRDNPSWFAASTGIAEAELAVKARHVVDQARRVGIDGGVFPPNVTHEQVVVTLQDLIQDANTELGQKFAALSARSIKEVDDVLTDSAATFRNADAPSTPFQKRAASMDASGRVGAAEGTDFITVETYQSAKANLWFRSLADKAKEGGNFPARLGNFLFNKMPNAYGETDYVYKRAAFKYAIKDGVKEGELRQIARVMDLSMEDVTPVMTDGVQRFKLHPYKALELANEAYLNYMAMPAAVRLLRTLPFVGAPFASFTYGMYSKAGRAALASPSAYNKIHMAIHEFSGDETPIEKGLLSQERYSYLDRESMVNLPFFQNNMVYLNLANIIPYYTLNMIQPPRRRYDGVLPDKMIQTLDRLPVMQEPIGSVLFDYLLLPHLVGEELPQGVFGNVLYPEDAGALEKGKYMARSLADPYTPGIMQPFVGLIGGTAANMGILPVGATQALPGYRTRTVAEGMQGNTAVGVQAREAPTSRTLRGISASFGFPIQSPVPYNRLDEDEALIDNQ